MAAMAEEQLAQLLMVGFTGPEPDEDAWRFLMETPPGSLLLFKHNITSQEQIASLLERIQDHCQRPAIPPILVATDQEGGRVARLSGDIGFPVSPSAASLAQSPNAIDVVRQATGKTAEALRWLGITMNLAPVLDVVTDPDNRVIGDRSFGSDPEIVARLGEVAIRAIQAEGVVATAKHFPGHGPTSVDSHLNLPVIATSRPELGLIHMRPFRTAIEAGVGAIMTAHAVYPALDAETPATLSRPILTDILRNELQYDGLIVTDSLTMQAISRHQSVPEACVAAFHAGADLLMVPASPTLYRQCLAALTDALAHGHITEEQVSRSVERIRWAREWVYTGGPQ